MTSTVRAFRNWSAGRLELNPNPYLSGNFKPEEYLRTYYPTLPEPSVFGHKKMLKDVSEENLMLLRFYADAQVQLQPTGEGLWMLEVGGGPTIYQLICLSRLVDKICFTDFLIPNLHSVENWIRTGHDTRWLSYIRVALQYEQGKAPTNMEMLLRERELKRKMSLVRYDVLRDRFFATAPKEYDLVSSNFCIECISQSKVVWLQALRNISKRIAEGGCLVMTALRMASTYNIHGRILPATPIDETDVWKALRDLDFSNIKISSRDCLGKNEYNGMIYVMAQKGS
ncbi:MAG: guanitoxin biosynthesis pre-guanitoxin forming N-methyltransferase GntF [Patescibacteria group bacterium]